MLKVQLHKQAADFLDKNPTKHARQSAERIAHIKTGAGSVLSEELKGFTPFRRMKSGEYRVIFFVENETLHIPVIGKRHDDDIYKQIARMRR